MSNKHYVDNFAAPLLAELDKLKSRLVDEMEINEKMKLNQVKLEEQMKIEVEKIVTLEGKVSTLEETLVTKEEVIKVLTGGANRKKGYFVEIFTGLNN